MISSVPLLQADTVVFTDSCAILDGLSSNYIAGGIGISKGGL
jgi:hypothetical protein